MEPVINMQFNYLSRSYNVFKSENSRIQKHSLIDIVCINIKSAHGTASLNNIKNDPRKRRMTLNKSQNVQFKYAVTRFRFETQYLNWKTRIKMTNRRCMRSFEDNI
jgi:hypothetical protein